MKNSSIIPILFYFIIFVIFIKTYLIYIFIIRKGKCNVFFNYHTCKNVNTRNIGTSKDIYFFLPQIKLPANCLPNSWIPSIYLATRKREREGIMVLILDGSSEHSAHIWSKSGISICWKHLVTSKESSNPIFFFGKDLCSKLPSYLTMEGIKLDKNPIFSAEEKRKSPLHKSLC